jgi:transposase
MEKVIFIGLDVDNQGIYYSGIDEETGEIFEGQSRPTAGSLIKTLKKVCRDRQIRCCYESGYVGFGLARALRKAGIACEVVATSLIPREAGRVQKNNRLDAQKLARYFRQNLLQVVHIPDECDEQVRDVIRARDFLVQQRSSLKRYILAQCYRVGWDYRQELGKPHAGYWTKVHQAWLEKKVNAVSGEVVGQNLGLLLHQLNHCTELIERYEGEITKLCDRPRYREKVNALICYRGIDELTAMTIVSELGDIHRFSHPRKLTSYVGLDLREYSSGDKERRYGISKLGNRFLRTAIVESAQFAPRPPTLSKQLRSRRESVAHRYIEIADRCMLRTCQKGQRLLYRGKHPNKVKVALAREMLGFIWESLRAAA